MCNTFNLELKKWCWRSFGFVSVLVLGMCYIGSVQADVCFLPSGNCLSDTNLAAPQNYGGEDCSTYIATYRQQHLEYAADCVTCGGREYCKCGSDRRLVGNQCLCQDSDKIIKNGSCTACPSNKEKASETTCQCKSIYNYTPVTNEVCTDSCSESELVGSGATTTAYSNSAQATASSSSATSSYQAAYTGGTNQFAQTSGSHAVLQGTYASMSQSGTSSGSNAYAASGGNTMQSAAIQLYNKRSCGCKSGYEYVGDQCLEECDSSKGLTRVGTECVCSDSKKEWSNTENKCVCKTEYDPDGNGGCLTPGCQNPHQVRVNGTCQCDTNSGYYDSIDICKLYLPSTQAYNLNWWDLLQQKATNAVYEVAQCLMPVKAVYAVEHEGYSGWFPQIHGEFEEFDNDTGNLNGGVGELDSGLPVYGGGASGGTTGGGLGNSDTPNQSTDGNGYFRPSIDTGNDNHLDEGIEARCRRKCAGSAGTAFSSCMADCMEYGLLNDNLQETTVGIDGEYDGPVDGDSSVPTVSYSCEPDTAGTCWSVQKHCDNSQYLYNDEDECNTATNSSCIQDSDGCWHKKNRWLILDGDPDHSGYLPQVFVDGVEVNNGQSTGWWLGQKIYEGSRVIVKVNKTECSEDTCNGKFKRFWIEGETFPVDQTVIGFTLDDTFVQEHNRTWNDSYLYIDLEYYTDADYGDECTFVSINRDSDAAEVIDYSRSSGILWPDSRCNVTAYLWRYNGTYYCMYSPDGNEPAGDLYVKNSYWYSDDTCNGNGRYWNLSSRGYVMY